MLIDGVVASGPSGLQLPFIGRGDIIVDDNRDPIIFQDGARIEWVEAPQGFFITNTDNQTLLMYVEDEADPGTYNRTFLQDRNDPPENPFVGTISEIDIDYSRNLIIMGDSVDFSTFAYNVVTGARTVVYTAASGGEAIRRLLVDAETNLLYGATAVGTRIHEIDIDTGSILRTISSGLNLNSITRVLRDYRNSNIYTCGFLGIARSDLTLETAEYWLPTSAGSDFEGPSAYTIDEDLNSIVFFRPDTRHLYFINLTTKAITSTLNVFPENTVGYNHGNDADLEYDRRNNRYVFNNLVERDVYQIDKDTFQTSLLFETEETIGNVTTMIYRTIPGILR